MQYSHQLGKKYGQKLKKAQQWIQFLKINKIWTSFLNIMSMKKSLNNTLNKQLIILETYKNLTVWEALK